MAELADSIVASKLQAFKTSFPDFFEMKKKEEVILNRLGIDRGMVDVKTLTRRSTLLQGGTTNRSEKQDVDFDQIVDVSESLEINRVFQRPVTYNPLERDLWGGKDDYAQAYAMTGTVASDVAKELCHTIVREAVSESPILNGGDVFTLNPSTDESSNTTRNFMIETAEIVRQDAHMVNGEAVDLYTTSNVAIAFLKGVSNIANSFGAGIQGGMSYSQNIFGGRTITSWDIPVKFDLNLTSNLAVGDTISLWTYQGHLKIEMVATDTTFGENDFNQVSLGSSIAGTLNNIGEFLDADVQNASSGEHSKKSFYIKEESDISEGDNYHTFRESNQIYTSVVRETDGTIDTSSNNITIEAYGVNSVRTKSADIFKNSDGAAKATVGSVDNIVNTILFVVKPCVEYAFSSKYSVTDVISQTSPNNLIWRKMNVYGQYGRKLFSGDKFYIKRVLVQVS